jgi:hypothetical protein
MATTLVRIQLLSKSGAEFATTNPVLLDGELGIADSGSTRPVVKIGDGVRLWTALPELTPWVLLNSDSHVTGDWVFDATQFFGFTPAEVVQIKSPPDVLWQSDGSDAIHAQSRVVITARNTTPTLLLRHTEGTSYAAPTPVPAVGILGQVRFEGSRGAGLAPAMGSRIVARALNDWSAGSSPGYVEVLCVPPGSTTEQAVTTFAAGPAYNEISVRSPQGRGAYLQFYQLNVAQWQIQNAANSPNLAWVTGGSTICLTLTPAGALTATNNVRSQTWLQGDTGVGNATLANALTWNAATYLYGSASLKGARNGFVGLALEVPSAPTFMADSAGCGVYLQTPGRWAWLDNGSVFQVSLPMTLPGASLAGTAPALIWSETDAAADNKLWRVAVNNNAQSFQVGTDAGVYVTWLQASRTGNVLDAIAFSGTALTFNGTQVSLVGHTHDAADVTTGIFAPVRLGTGTPSASRFLSGDGAWSIIAGSNVSGAALTKTDDTNVTLTLGGTPASALLRAASLTLGWTGQLAVARGGSGVGTLTGYVKGNGTAAFTASATIPYSDLSGAPAIPAVANPTAKVGLVAVPGVATTSMRSDAAPPIDQAIAPTWTGQHAFNLTPTAGGAAMVVTTDPRLTVFTAAKSGIAPLSGGGTANYLRADGTWTTPPGTGGAAPGNPTAKVGLVAVPGVEITFMRSDAAPALDVAMAPTWSGLHTFSQKITSTVVAAAGTSTYGLSLESVTPFWHLKQTNAAANNGRWQFGANAEQLLFGALSDNGLTSTNWLTVDRTGIVIDEITLQASVITSSGNISFSSTSSGLRGSSGQRILDFAPSYYGTVRVTALDGGLNGFIGVQLGSALNTLFMGNGTLEGIHVTGDSKWLIRRSTATTALCQYTLTSSTFDSSSSRTIKRETGTPTKVQDILKRLRPILYRLLEGYDVEQLGLIAEEVHELCPYLSPDGTTVAYDRLAVLLLADWQSRYAHVA